MKSWSAMAEAQQEEIFGLGTKLQIGTRGESGTGLGLNLVKELVELNQGVLRVSVRKSEGSKNSARF